MKKRFLKLRLCYCDFKAGEMQCDLHVNASDLDGDVKKSIKNIFFRT